MSKIEKVSLVFFILCVALIIVGEHPISLTIGVGAGVYSAFTFITSEGVSHDRKI